MREAADFAISWMTWTPVAPVPMTATRWSAEVDRLVRPLRGVERRARERVETGDVWHLRHRQRADRRNEEARRRARAVGELDRPFRGGVVERGAFHACVELEVAPQVELVGDVLEVAQCLRLRREAFAPLPLLEEFVGERVPVRVALGVEPRAGIAVPVPRTADVAAGLEAADRQAELTQPVELVEPGDAGSDDDGVVRAHGRRSYDAALVREEHGDDPLSTFLILGVRRVGGDRARPPRGALVAAELAHSHRERFGAVLELHGVGIGEQVEVPDRVLGCATDRRNERVLAVVLDAHERRLPRFCPSCCHAWSR